MAWPTWVVGGQRVWRGSIDDDGHRNWGITFLTQGPAGYGPATHVQTPGLPTEGSVWQFDGDIDIWAWCRSGPTTIDPVQGKDDQQTHFETTYTFSTRPPGGEGGGSPGSRKDDRGSRKKCADQRIEDPLQEPPSTSGGGIRYTEEAETNRLGQPIRYTSFEQIRGPKIEFDKHRDQVVVEQNVINLQQGFIRGMMDCVNLLPLWDLPTRCWKLCDWTWQRRLYGTCSFYYTRRLIFESNAEEVEYLSDKYNRFRDYLLAYAGKYYLSGWDKNILDESNKVLKGHWVSVFGTPLGWTNDNLPDGTAPDYRKQGHYINATLPDRTPTRIILSKTNRGNPATDDDDAYFHHIEKYQAKDMLQLGIPLYL